MIVGGEGLVLNSVLIWVDYLMFIIDFKEEIKRAIILNRKR